MSDLSVLKLLQTAFLAFTLSAIGCTKARDSQIADEELDAELIAISELKGTQFKARFSKVASATQKPTSSLVGIPGKLQPLLQDQAIQGEPDTEVDLRFQIEPKTLFVRKVLQGNETLSALEKDLVTNYNAEKTIPLFAIPIKAAGVLVPIKNDLGERTHKFELRETDIVQASHVRVDLNAENTLRLQLPQDQPELAKEVIDANRLRTKIHTADSLNQIVPTGLNLAEGQYASELITDESLSPTQAKLLIYSVHRKSQIRDGRLLAQLAGGVARLDIKMCGDALASQVRPVVEATDCVLILERSLLAFQVKAELATDNQGRLTDKVQLQAVAQGALGNLIQIKQDSVVRIENSTDRLNLTDTQKISMDLLRGKEFLFRRTFENAASTLMAFGPGASGNLDIVKFVFEANRLVVKRVTSINGDANPLEIDNEDLFSVPAEYFQTRDAKGLILQPARQTTPDKADMVALDWLKNTIPVANSPLSFLSAGQCFLSVGHQAIQDMDQRLADGIFNFSIQGAYTFRPECMSVFGLNDYWYELNAQSTYTLSERLSFKVHDPKHDHLKTQDLPFRAQQLLGFGAFTIGQRQQDAFGNTNRLTDEQARPVLQKFLDGRSITYVLGGATAGTRQGELVTKAAQQVVADWNEALARAFRGTSLERKGAYIELLIEGQDIHKGHLGDLDRNYIFNFEKNMDSGLLGLSQAGPNPRTGFVESSNVLMYGGNLMAYIGYEAEVQRIQTEYEALKKQVLKQGLQTAPQASAEPAPIQTPGDLAQDTVSLQDLIGQAGEFRRPQTPISVRKFVQSAAKVSVGVRSHLQTLRQTQVDNSGLKSQALEKIISQRDYIQRIIQKAIRLGEMQNPEFLEALTAAEILKSYGSEVTADEKRLLAIESQRLALRAEFTKNFRRGPNCLLAAPTVFNAKVESQKSADEQFLNLYSDTLSHEIGHNLGLTHNFKGSLDKANFEFESESTGREYSSVMDYKPTSHTDYRKPGPYDVHALRAAYTGLMEVSESVQKAAQQINGQSVVRVQTPEAKIVDVVLNQGRFVALQDLKNVLVPERTDSQGQKMKSFWDLNAQHLARLPLKAHGFCTDIDVGGDPTCARWDAGTTPQEVAQFYIDDYKAMYPVLNARNARINGIGFGSYFYRIMMAQMNLRGFLDESLFQLIQGQPQNVWVPYALAAWSAMNHFVETVSTPNVNLGVFDQARFSVEEIETQNETGAVTKTQILVERKALQDLRVPGFDSAIETRGFEMDKLLALQFLTLQSLGNPRYDQVSLRFSFVDFERLLLGLTEDQSLVLRTLEGALSSQLQAVQFVGNQALTVPGNLSVDVTESMRYYSILGSTVLLDNSSTVDSANPSRLFLVGSSLNQTPTDRPIVTRLSSKLESPTALKLFAHDPASSINRLVRKAARDRLVIENQSVLAAGISKLLTAVSDADKATARKALVEQLMGLNSKALLVSGTEAEQLGRLQAQAELVEQFVMARQGLVTQIEEILKSGATLEQLAEQIGEIRKSDEALTKEVPVLMVAQVYLQNTMTTDQQKLISAQLLNPGVLELEHGSIVGSLEQMNRIIALMNPELNR